MSSPNRLRVSLLALTVALLLAASARATLPSFLQHVVSASSIESALFRLMQLPTVQALYPRPPREAQAQLTSLIAATPADPNLLALRARAAEQSLDFPAAEADWKLFAAKSPDPAAAQLDLADFYARRLQFPQQAEALTEVINSPPRPSEKFTDPTGQRSWRAANLLLKLDRDQALPSTPAYEAFLRRYPGQPAVYTHFLHALLDSKDFSAAEALIPRYTRAFPQDRTFPVSAAALIAFRRGDSPRALALYDSAFDPLWPAPLVESFFSLLTQTHSQRTFLAAAETRLQQHPDDLNALARIFFYHQQAGRLPAALQTLDRFRLSKESRGTPWSPLDLYTLTHLTTDTQSWTEAARYSFALASTPGALPSGEPAAQAGLASLIHLLLTAPDQPFALGAGNLTLYRDIATLDQGPGFWNGILSLWLNAQSPESEYNAESTKAQPYFHRSKAAALLADLDRRFPAAPQRSSLHAELLHAEAEYGEPATVVASGRAFLAAFPNSPARVEVAGLMADSYARQKDSASEFALYDSLLAELAAKTAGQPLTAAPVLPPKPQPVSPDGAVDDFTPPPPPPAFELPNPTPIRASIPEAALYAQVLDRYLARLTAAADLPRALTVLRRQLDQNPDDPLLYERLATFLQQNNLSAEQENVYKLAIARFNPGTDARRNIETDARANTAWYDRLALLYLKQRRRQDFAALTRQVTSIFSGTDLDDWFRKVQPGTQSLGPELALQLNLYAAKRFPHDLVFTKHLLTAYTSAPTRNPAAWEALIRRHWWESPDLRDQFFEFLTRTNKLQAELAALQPSTPSGDSSQPSQVTSSNPAALPSGTPSQTASPFEVGSTNGPGAPSQTASPFEVGSTALNSGSSNPASTRELAELHLWTSHFELAAPLFQTLSTLYPADPDLGDRAVSLFRSLAYLDPAATPRAVAIEQRLLTSTPADADRLATLGDLYAEATSTAGEDLRSAAPYWRRIPLLHPGSPAGALTAATIFWDYFQFPEALAEITSARTRFHAPTLFGFEAGAILENQHNLPAAIHEYTAVITDPPADPLFLASVDAAVTALRKPPSDAADSNLQSTAQSIFNSAEARTRLIQLSTRPSTRALVDQATAAAASSSPTPAALALRADVLIAQDRRPEVAPLLTLALDHAKSADEAAAIGDLARTHSAEAADPAHLREVDVTLTPNAPKVTRKFTPAPSYSLTEIYERSLEKQSALAIDPVQKIELQYTLARSLEDRRDIPAATAVITSVYRSNPRLLGVVRTTVDFFARTHQPAPAIATLLEAARAATPTLAESFTLEAAQRANTSGQPQQARTLALTLLARAPYDPRFLAAVAQSYAATNDNAGLKSFYEAQLAAVRTAPDLTPNLDPAARRHNTALLRRGLIPALTRLHDDTGALNQYIALLSAFPEDAATAHEAALHALRTGHQSQLTSFLTKTVHDSPRDSRFAILLAQTQTTFGDLPAAVAAYSQAIAIRADRTDLYIARADLNLRLDHPEPAAADFQRLFILTYHDPAWMLRLAELRARQARPADAVKALQTAFLTGRPPTPALLFTVASHLERWNLLPEARTFAEQAIALAGPTLLAPAIRKPDPDADPEATPIPASPTLATSPASPNVYFRILTRLNQPEAALSTLTAARRAADAATPATVASAALKLDPASDPKDRAAFTRDFTARRHAAVNAAFTDALTSISTIVATYSTPEQKLHFADLLTAARNPAEPQPWIAAAHAAALPDREAEWLRQTLLAPQPIRANLARYTELQRSRLAFADLATTLETYAARLTGPKRDETRRPLLQQAAESFHAAGDLPAELRLLRALSLAPNPDPTLRDRFLDLLLRRDPAALAALAASPNPDLADAAASFALAHATPPQAFAAIDARAKLLPALWHPATRALAGLYFLDSKPAAPQTMAAFREILAADLPISARLSASPKPELSGDLFFPYASRYGIAETVLQPAAAEDFLPAALELHPASPAPYRDLARTYADAGNPAAALTEYTHALELLPADPATLDDRAALLATLNRPADALADWRLALTSLRRLAERNSFPERFFSASASITAHLGEHHLTSTLRPDLESILRPTFTHNGNFRSNELLQHVYLASATPADGLALILSSTNAAPAQDLILQDLARAPWLDLPSREAILLRRIELARIHPAATGEGDSLTSLQNSLIQLLLDANDLPRAQSLLDSIPTDSAAPIDSNHLQLAVRTHHLTPLLESWTLNPDLIPPDSTLSSALYYLRRRTPAYTPNLADSRPLQEFLFDHKSRADTLDFTDYLDLAQTRIDTGDLPGALVLLHRLALAPVSGISPAHQTEDGTPYPVPYTSSSTAPTPFNPEPVLPADPIYNVDAAARLLESTHHLPEAIPFLTTLTHAAPWNCTFRLRLARAQLAAGSPAPQTLAALNALARDPLAPYSTRAEAAHTLATTHTPVPDLASAELNLLASSTPTPTAARQPYFVAARIAAASIASPVRETLLREAIALAPDGPQTDSARLLLLTAELESNHPTPAIALLESLPKEPNTPPADLAYEIETGDAPFQPSPALLPEAAASLDPAARLHLAQLIAAAYRADGNVPEALNFLQLALTLKPSDPTLPREIKKLQSTITLAEKNTLRRPIIHAALLDADNVRPRLTEAP